MALNGGYTYREELGSRARGLSLLAYLSRHYTHSDEREWRARLKRGEVSLDGRAARGSELLRPGQRLEWRRPPWNEEEVPLRYDLIFRDAALLAVSKPGGLPTLPGGGFLEHTLLSVVRRDFPGASPLHRLGRGTSGLVLFARTPGAAASLTRAWREGEVRKRYRALALGVAERDGYSITVPIGPVPHPRLGRVFAASAAGKASRSEARVLERRPDGEGRTLFEVDIPTGRPHQIRIHLASVGHPLVGDPLYVSGGLPRADLPGLPGDGGYLLHAGHLAFPHPLTGEWVTLHAPPPPELRCAGEPAASPVARDLSPGVPARRRYNPPVTMVAAPGAHVWTLEGGLTLAFERRPGPGFALDLRVPVGSAHDPPGLEGSAGVLEEWLYKGAGGRDARGLQDAFDDLGVRRSGGVGPEATRFGASGLTADLPAALGLIADLLRRPALPAGELPILTDLARQDLEGLEDSPTDLLALEARRLAFPRPPASRFAGYAHPASGTPEGLARLDAEGLRAFFSRYGPRGSVVGVVADAEAGEVRALVERALAGWTAGEAEVVPADFRPGLRAHVPHEDAEQTHLSVTAPGVAPRSPDWLAWQVALTALSGGSASRLFHAVREERGLAYSVMASPVLLGGRGFLSAYAGSTPDRAPETLEVVLAELARLPQGLTDAEFGRARAGLTASVVFGAESLRSRAAGLTRDLAVFGRVRSVAELRAGLAALSLEQVNAFLAGYDPAPAATVVTLGPGEAMSA